MRLRLTAAAGLLAMALGLTTLTAASAPWPGGQEVEQTLAQVRSYYSQYQTDLTVVLAQETTLQRITGQHPRETGMPLVRATVGEVYFRFVEDARSWMAIREVKTVDGEPADTSPGLATALREQSTGTVARTFKAFNSRFNIGRIVRTFNEPTLALGILDPGRIDHFTFALKGSKVQDGVRLVTLAFREMPNAEPFVFDLQMEQADVRGEFLVEVDTGRIRETTLNLTIGTLRNSMTTSGVVRAELKTTYAHDENLDLWVPVMFNESYKDGFMMTGVMALSVKRPYEEISCESEYSNFRRFTATARIK